VLIIVGVVIRAGVFPPDTVRDLRDDEDAAFNARQAPGHH
jgi:hypothetical protein